MKPWKTLSSKQVFSRPPILDIYSDRCKMQNGKTVDPYWVVKKDDYAMIAAFTPEMKIVLVEQYRHPVKAVDFELPAGFLEKSDKSAAHAIKRELLEETGYTVTKVKKLGEFFASPAIFTNHAHLFIGFGAKKIAKQKLDHSEDIIVHVVSAKKALEYVKKGHMKDLSSAFALHLALKEIKR